MKKPLKQQLDELNQLIAEWLRLAKKQSKSEALEKEIAKLLNFRKVLLQLSKTKTPIQHDEQALMLTDRPWEEVDRLEKTFGKEAVQKGCTNEVPKEVDLLKEITQSNSIPSPLGNNLDDLKQIKREKRNKNKLERTKKDKLEHAERRILNQKFDALTEVQYRLGQEYSRLFKNLMIQHRQLDGLIREAGQVRRTQREREKWEEKKTKYRKLERNINENRDTLQDVKERLTEQKDKNVRDVELRTLNNKLSRLVSDEARKWIKWLKTQEKQLNIYITSLQKMLDKPLKLNKDDIKYPKVWVHKKVVNCPYYDNIPFGELNNFTATGTHGKSAEGRAVHKKLAGGYAITFIYQGGKAYVIDCGPKAPNTEQYKWKRGGTSYDSTAGLGDSNDYIQE